VPDPAALRDDPRPGLGSLRRLMTDAGIEAARAHPPVFRHTYAVRAVRAGMPPIWGPRRSPPDFGGSPGWPACSGAQGWARLLPIAGGLMSGPGSPGMGRATFPRRLDRMSEMNDKPPFVRFSGENHLRPRDPNRSFTGLRKEAFGRT